MSRKKKIYLKRNAEDPIYSSFVVAKFINKIMVDGKKNIAQNILYSAFDVIDKNLKTNSLDVFLQAVENVTPKIEVRSRRVGGTNYQVPIEINDIRKNALALRWLIKFSRLRNEKTMVQKLANEIIDAYNKSGATFKKKEDTHKMAESNKAFSHFRW